MCMGVSVSVRCSEEKRLPEALLPSFFLMGLGFRGYIGIMEKKMETTIAYWGYIGLMEKKWKLL